MGTEGRWEHTFDREREAQYGDIEISWNGTWASAVNIRSGQAVFAIKMGVAGSDLPMQIRNASTGLVYGVAIGTADMVALDAPIDQGHAEIQAMIAYKQAAREGLRKW